MQQRRISLSDLVLGKPLPWDLYPADPLSGPVLRKGQVLTDSSQFERWVDSGLFVGDDGAPSVLHLLNQSNQRLERLLLDLRNESNAERELRDIAHDVVTAVDMNPDVAVASILLNQIAGTYGVRHCIETAIIAVLVARGMDKPAADILVIAAAALTMNVGMLRHQDNFQNKRTPLSREEMDIVRRHPSDSAALLQCAGISDDAWLDCVMQHHEKDDGSGYPDGTSAPDVSQNAKLLSLADRYCAHVSARNYRRSVCADQTLQQMFLDAPEHSDAELAGQFVRLLGKYPPGTLVQLHNGEIGVVVHGDGDGRGLHVHPLRDSEGTIIGADALPLTARRRTAEAGHGIASALSEDDAAVRFSMKHIWGEHARL